MCSAISIEVTTGNAGSMTDTDEGRAHLHPLARPWRMPCALPPPPLPSLKARSPTLPIRALSIELAAFQAMTVDVVSAAEVIKAASLALATVDVSADAILAEEQNYARPVVDHAHVRHRGRPPSRRRAGAEAPGGPMPSSPMAAICSPPSGEEGGAIWLLTGSNMGGKSTSSGRTR